jgi:hypothetical protein
MVRVRQLAVKALGTSALALGFVWLVSRSPFFPQPAPAGGATSANNAMSSTLMMPVFDFNTGIIPAATFELLESIRQEGGFQPALGLMRAQFAETEDSPGFINEERAVTGPCDGAGMRHAQEICPGCAVWEHAGDDGLPPVVLWTELVGGTARVSAATRNCVSLGPNGEPIISHLEFGGDRVDLAGESFGAAAAQVPLPAGAMRIAVVEMGGWVAVIDRPGRPSTALRDMLALMDAAGWRDAPSLRPEPPPYFEGQRVVVNDRGQYAVVAMSRHAESYQLVTIVTSGAGG